MLQNNQQTFIKLQNFILFYIESNFSRYAIVRIIDTISTLVLCYSNVLFVFTTQGLLTIYKHKLKIKLV